MPEMNHDMSHESGPAHRIGPYVKFWLSLAANAILMFVFMFVMINTWSEFIFNLNFVYMALVMAAPMGILMLATMPKMYAAGKKNMMSYIALAVILIGSFAFIRQQTLIGDRAFLDSMIPHHSGAILMCRKAKLTDPEILSLCQGIKKSQQDEIDQMRRIKARLR